VVIVQGDRFDATASTTVCPLTTNPTEVPLTRIPSEASPLHGPDQPSRLMVDKVMTMPRSSRNSASTLHMTVRSGPTGSAHHKAVAV
jgi:mRNA-degrading endonuclease toxin of MazEF toxin-antitoxin module